MQQRFFPMSTAALGPDRLIRMRVVELRALRLHHSSSVEDPSVLADYPHACRAGVTEWVGSVGSLSVSMGWDWCQMADGALLHLGVVAPRANVKLLDTKGYDMDPQQELHVLNEFIEHSKWQQCVRAALEGLRNAPAMPAAPCVSLRYH